MSVLAESSRGESSEPGNIHAEAPGVPSRLTLKIVFEIAAKGEANNVYCETGAALIPRLQQLSQHNAANRAEAI